VTRFAVVAALLAITRLGPLFAQDRALLQRGITARVGRGGIGLPDTTAFRDTTIAIYPDARFYYVDLPLEHGGSKRLYEALDRAGQLYLLDSPASFRLLHLASFRGTVDSATAVEIAILATRFGGLAPAPFQSRDVWALPMRASVDTGRVLWAWTVSFDYRLNDKWVPVKYWIYQRDGDQLLMSRDCDAWCQTPILDP
jgi:hypothetical protein